MAVTEGVELILRIIKASQLWRCYSYELPVCAGKQESRTLRKGRESTSTKLSEKIFNAQSRAAVTYFVSRQKEESTVLWLKAGQPKKYCCPVPRVPVIIASF